MHHVMSQLRRYQEDRAAASAQKWKLPPCGQPVAPFSNATTTRGRAVIRPTDDSKTQAHQAPIRPMWGQARAGPGRPCRELVPPAPARAPCRPLSMSSPQMLVPALYTLASPQSSSACTARTTHTARCAARCRPRPSTSSCLPRTSSSWAPPRTWCSWRCGRPGSASSSLTTTCPSPPASAASTHVSSSRRASTSTPW